MSDFFYKFVTTTVIGFGIIVVLWIGYMMLDMTGVFDGHPNLEKDSITAVRMCGENGVEKIDYDYKGKPNIWCK